jgi:outer membrane phospholipase A
MQTFYSQTSLNGKYEIKSYIEIPEAGKNYSGSNIVEYKGNAYFNLPYHYWVSKKTLDLIVEKYNALQTFM